MVIGLKCCMICFSIKRLYTLNSNILNFQLISVTFYLNKVKNQLEFQKLNQERKKATKSVYCFVSIALEINLNERVIIENLF